MPKNFPKPPVASFPIWKTILLGIGQSLIFTFLVWLFSALLPMIQGNLPDWSLSALDVLLGSVMLPITVYSRWAWQPRRKNAHWHRWIVNLSSGLYISGLLLTGAISYWNAILPLPWNVLINSLFLVMFLVAWVLPVLSYPLAKRLEEAQHTLDLYVLKWGGLSVVGIAGIIGANIGLHSDWRSVIVAVLFPIVAIGLAQYIASYLWPYRPWAKEDE